MYELVQVGERTFYLEGPTKIGVYRVADDSVWLIDAGNDKDAARRICKAMNETGWTIEGVVNTHSNADHIGGNSGLQQRTGCKIIGTELENAITRFPHLEPSLLWGGFPMKGLRNKFLMAPASVPNGTVMDGLPQGLEAIPLPGHFLDMCGIRTDDDVVFLADSVFGESTIGRYHVFFVYDVQGFLETLDRIETMKARVFIPSHAEATEDIVPLIRKNREKVLEIADAICTLCAAPLGFEEILRRVFYHYDLTMDINQYVLVGSTIRSYLSYLCDEGQLQYEFSENSLLFHST